MDWIQPLQMETWIMNVFSGSIEVFTIVALMFIIGMAAFFRMTAVAMFLMIGIFLLMFAGFVTPSLFIVIGLIAAMLVGTWIARLFNR